MMWGKERRLFGTDKEIRQQKDGSFGRKEDGISVFGAFSMV